MFSNSRKACGGAVLITAALWMLILLAFTGFAISVGQICIAKQRAQDAADAVVCAGASAWEPYLYEPADSDPTHDAGSWRRKHDNSTIVSVAEALEMADCAEANENTFAAFPVEWDGADAVSIDRNCSYNTETGEWFLSINISAKMRSLSDAFFPGFGKVISAAAISNAVVNAKLITWAVDRLEPGTGYPELLINPTGGPRARDGIHSVLPPEGLDDPESPPNRWINRMLTSRQWNYNDTDILLNIINSTENDNRVIVLPIRTKTQPSYITGFCAIRIDSMTRDSGGIPYSVSVYCLGRDDRNPNILNYYKNKSWRWTYRLLP